MIVHVDDASDPRLDDYRNVPDPELLRTRGLFIAEGRLVVRRLFERSRFTVRSVLVTPAACEGLRDLLAQREEVPVYVVPQHTLNDVSGFNIHRGCLAVGERHASPSWREIAQSASRLVVLERVSNADNVGVIFRSASAFGTDAILLGPGCADPLYRKAIRTSMGATLQLPFAAMHDWPADLIALRADGFTLLALTPQPATPLTALADGTHAQRTALLVGHEGEGLSAEALAGADMSVRIPMASGIDSLNAATAASIALYELFARRSRNGPADRGNADRNGTDPIWDRPGGI